MVRRTADVSRSSRRPSARVNGNLEKVFTPNFSRVARGIQESVAPVSTIRETSSVRSGAVRFARFTFTSNMPIECLDLLLLLDLGQELDEFLLALGLVVASGGVGKLRSVHGAEFRAAHGAELSFLVEVVGQGFVGPGAGGTGDEGTLRLVPPSPTDTA